MIALNRVKTFARTISETLRPPGGDVVDLALGDPFGDFRFG